jgi:hypothetical protein
MRTLQIIACPCGKIKAFGDWRWNHLEFSEVLIILFMNCKVEVGEDFFITVHYEFCDECKEKYLRG